MAAGILSYQLCDRAFDCDTCPLDSAMRMHFSRKDIRPVEPPPHEASHGYRYSSNHCWIARTSPSAVRIGIEPTLAGLLAPKELVLPGVGDVVALDQYCCWIITEGGTLHIASPVSGSVTAVNPALALDPFVLSHSPLMNGWLFEVRMRSALSSESSLMTKTEAEPRYRSDQEHFSSLVRTAIGRERASVGASLPDGGEMLRDVAAMLGAKRYFELVNAVYGSGDRGP
jgi:glycine cleavage system H lipoate-binding protein